MNMKTVFITGAGKGIGFEIVKLFLKSGDFNVIALSRNITALEQLNSENLNAFSFDLAQEDYSALPALTEITHGLDVLINNAGLLVNKRFESLTTQEWQQMVAVNLLAPAQLIKLFLPHLKESNHGHVVNISSMGGFQGASKFPGLSAYSSTKAALACLSECLAEEYQDTQIHFNSLSLGAVNTSMLNTAFPDYNAPLNADEMAQFIYDFAINGHRFFNGKNLPVALHNPS